MLYSILGDIAIMYPDTIQMAYVSLLSSCWPTNQVLFSRYESLQDRIKDTFANSSNPTIIHYVSNIIRIALDDGQMGGSHIGVLRGSSSTLNTLDDAASIHGPGRSHLKALEEQRMQGLSKNFQFLPAQNAGAGKVLMSISNLVAHIVSYFVCFSTITRY